MTRSELLHLLAGGLRRNFIAISETQALEAAESALRELEAAGLRIEQRPGSRPSANLDRVRWPSSHAPVSGTERGGAGAPLYVPGGFKFWSPHDAALAMRR